MATTAKQTTSSHKQASTRARQPVSALDVLRFMFADFSDPAAKSVFIDTSEYQKKAKKVARALLSDLRGKASKTPDKVYHTPGLVMMRGAYYFGDLADMDMQPFLVNERREVWHVLPFHPLTGITCAEAADIFLFDEKEVLVPLTALALTLEEQFRCGNTDAIIRQKSYFLVCLLKHLETGVNVRGYVDLPRELRAQRT